MAVVSHTGQNSQYKYKQKHKKGNKYRESQETEKHQIKEKIMRILRKTYKNGGIMYIFLKKMIFRSTRKTR
jgi:outer membrane lipoprotein-sorting protein